MSEAATGSARTWHLETFEPLDAPSCIKIGEFLASQTHGRSAALCAAIMRWKLFENEVRPGFASAMVADDTRRIVSTCTVTPKRLWCDGTIQCWAEIGDTFTDDQFKRKGMFSDLVNASRSRAQTAGFGIVYGLPNDQSAPGYLKKLDFAIKGNAALHSYALLLSTVSLVPRLGRRVPTSIAKRLLSRPLTDVSRMLSRVMMWRPQNRSVEIGSASIATAEFDGLWDAVRGFLPIAQVRDARYVDWRYVRHPLPFRVITARIGGELRGYLVTLLIDEPGPPAERRLWLVDWLFAPSEAGRVGGALLDAAIRAAVFNRADAVGAQASVSGPLPLPWRRYGFVRRPLLKPVIVHMTDAGRRFLNRDDPWHYTISDTDGY